MPKTQRAQDSHAEANKADKPRRRRHVRALDDIDYMILHLLQEKGPLTDKEISAELDHGSMLLPAACGKRVKFLVREGYFRTCHYLLNSERLGVSHVCFMYAKVPDKHTEDSFREAVQDDPRVQELHSVFGDFDYIMKVRVRDKKEAMEMSRAFSGRGFPVTTVETGETFKETPVIRLSQVPLSTKK